MGSRMKYNVAVILNEDVYTRMYTIHIYIRNLIIYFRRKDNHISIETENSIDIIWLEKFRHHNIYRWRNGGT